MTNYKITRPIEGYSTESERNMASWSGVSDWEVLFKGKKIGIIYKTKSWGGDWGWNFEHSDKSLSGFRFFKNKGYSLTRRNAFEEIVHSNEQFMKEGGNPV